MAPRTPGAELEADYYTNWLELATFAIESNHGAAARFAIMFALSLKWPTVADGEHIEYVRPRVWLVGMPCGAKTQRASLFEDSLLEALLNTVARTAELPIPVFPRLPCGSRDSEVWAHSYASRKHHRDEKNFVALCRKFAVAAGEAWSPLDIYAASICIFDAMFTWSAVDEDAMLSRQLGTKSAARAHYSLHWFKCSTATALHVGELRSDCHETTFIPDNRAGAV